MKTSGLRVLAPSSSRSSPARVERARGFRKASRPASRFGVVAWVAAGVGILLFALAGVASVSHLVTEEQFWVLSAAGLALYLSAHCLGVSYHAE